jgi:hypothetical protein
MEVRGQCQNYRQLFNFCAVYLNEYKFYIFTYRLLIYLQFFRSTCSTILTGTYRTILTGTYRTILTGTYRTILTGTYRTILTGTYRTIVTSSRKSAPIFYFYYLRRQRSKLNLSFASGIFREVRNR